MGRCHARLRCECPPDSAMTDPKTKPTISIAEHAQFRNIPEDKLVKMLAMQNEAQIRTLDPATPPEQWIRQNQNSELVQKGLDRLYSTSKILGFGNGKAMLGAIDAARVSGQPTTFVSLDGSNFGGMAKQVGSQDVARAHEKAMVDIAKNALAKQGLDVQAFRPNPEVVGDEYGLVVKGDPKKLAAGLDAAKAEIAEYAKANGLTDLPYRKEGGPATKSVTLDFATEEITPEKTAKQIIDNAESKLKAAKTAPPATSAEPALPAEPPKASAPAEQPKAAAPAEPSKAAPPVEPAQKPAASATAEPATRAGPISRIPELKAGRALGGLGALGGLQQLSQADGDPYKQAAGANKLLSGTAMVFKPRAAGPLFIVQSTIETGIAAAEGYEKDGTKGAFKEGGYKVAEIASALIMYTPETFGHIGDWGGHVAAGDWGAAKKSSDEVLFSTPPGKLGQQLGLLYVAAGDYYNAKDAGSKMNAKSLVDQGKNAFVVVHDEVGGYNLGPAMDSPLTLSVPKLKAMGVIPKAMRDYREIEQVVSREIANPGKALRGSDGQVAPEYRDMLKASATDLATIYATVKQAKETGSVKRYQSKENIRESIAMLQTYLQDTPPDKLDKERVNIALAQFNERMKKFAYDDYYLKAETFTADKPAVDPALSVEAFRQKAQTRLTVMNAALMPERDKEFIPSKQLNEVKEKVAGLKGARAVFADIPDLLEKTVKQVPSNGLASGEMKEVAAKIAKMNASLAKAGKEPLKVSFDIATLPVGDPKAFAADPRFAELQQALDKVAKEGFGYAGIRKFTYTEQDEAQLKQTRGPAQEALKAELAALQKDGALCLYEKSEGGHGAIIQFMKDGKPDTSPQALAKLDKLATALVASNTGFLWSPEDGRLNVAGYTMPESLIAMDKQVKADSWQKKSAAAAIVARGELLVMAAGGNLSFAPDGSATLNLQSMPKWQERRETQVLLAMAGLSPTYASAEMATVEIDGRRTQVPALKTIPFKPQTLAKDGVAFKDMAEAAAFVGAQERNFLNANMELPAAIKPIAAKLKKGGGELTGDDIAAMIAFKKNPPPEVGKAADALRTQPAPVGIPGEKEHHRDMLVTVVEQFKSAAAAGDVMLLIKLDAAMADANKKSGNTDVKNPKTYATLGNLQQKTDYLNAGLAPDDKQYIDLKKIMGDKYPVLEKALKMNSDMQVAIKGGPNASPLAPRPGVAPATPAMPETPGGITK